MVPEVFRVSGWVWVRGIRVELTVHTINEYLGTQPNRNWELDDGGMPSADIFTEAYEELAAELRRDHQPVRDHDPHTVVEHNALLPELAFWSIFLKHNLTPSSHRSRVSFEVAKLLYAMRYNLGFDVGKIIFSSILKAGSQANCLLSFPCLITYFCGRAGIDLSLEEANLERPQADIGTVTYNQFCTRQRLPNLPREGGYRNRGRDAREQREAQGPPEAPARRARQPPLQPPREDLPANAPRWAAPLFGNVEELRAGQAAQGVVLNVVREEQRRVHQEIDRRFLSRVYSRGNRNYVFGESSGQGADDEN